MYLKLIKPISELLGRIIKRFLQFIKMRSKMKDQEMIREAKIVLKVIHIQMSFRPFKLTINKRFDFGNYKTIEVSTTDINIKLVKDV